MSDLSVILTGAILCLLVLLGLSFFFNLALGHLLHLPRRAFVVTVGAAFALTAIGTIIMAFPIAEGVIGDLRNVVVMSAGIFGGPWVAALCGLLTMAFRVYLGGQVVGAALGILTAAVIGGTYYRFRGGFDPQTPPVHYLGLGLGLALVNAALPWLGVMLDPGMTPAMALHVSWAILITAVVLYPLGTLLLCQFIALECRRLETDAQRRQLVADLSYQHNLLDTVLGAAHEAIYMHDRQGRYLFANDAGLRLAGRTWQEIRHRTLRELGLPLDIVTNFEADMAQLLDSGQPVTNALRIATPDGMRYLETRLAPVVGTDSQVKAVVSTLRDVTERELYEQHLLHQANYDALTELPNRHLLEDRLEQALRHAQRNNRQVAVLFLDLDRFKMINDSLGHDAGDELLRVVAGRLQGCVRDTDTVARLGGDEFVMVLEDLPAQETKVVNIAHKTLTALRQPTTLAGQEFFISSSIGISLYPQDGHDVQTLLKHADDALHQAKQSGRNVFQFYTATFHETNVQRMALADDLRQAVERGELELYYQPQVRSGSGQVTGLEVLLRWQHPRLGMIPPARFIPLAEELGLIMPLGRWVLTEACRQGVAWQQAGLPPLALAVNLSTRQFIQYNLVRQVEETLRQTGLEPARLELEITESALLRDSEGAVETLQALRELGIRLAIDDFGTGHSSLIYLRRFPLNRLKIDHSFVQTITSDPSGAAIAQSIIALAHGLGLEVVAEGVETPAQRDFLSLRQCDEMQGHLFSPPLSAREVEILLRQECRLPLTVSA